MFLVVFSPNFGEFTMGKMLRAAIDVSDLGIQYIPIRFENISQFLNDCYKQAVIINIRRMERIEDNFVVLLHKALQNGQNEYIKELLEELNKHRKDLRKYKEIYLD